MDYVYICRSGENEELRYSIRSILKNTDCSGIWLIGGKPEWYCGNYIETEQSGNRFQNTANSYKVIANSDNIPENFVLMNDDFYVLQQIKEIPLFYDGTLANKIDTHIAKNGLSAYARVLIKAKKDLIRYGIEDPLCYEVHLPMVFNKTMLSYLDYTNLSPRSTYGNIYNLGGEDMKDVKIYRRTKDISLSEKVFISTEDDSFNLIKDSLHEMFPDKSPYEK